MTRIVEETTPLPMISAKEAARQLGISIATLYRFIKIDGLPCVRIGGTFRLRQAEFDEWINTHKLEIIGEAPRKRSLLDDACSILDDIPDNNQTTEMKP